MTQASQLQAMRGSTVEPADLSHQRGCHAAPQHGFHRIERGGVVVWLEHHQPPRIEPEGKEARGMQVGAGRDPKRRAARVDPGQQNGGKGGGQGAGFGFQTGGTDFMQLA